MICTLSTAPQMRLGAVPSVAGRTSAGPWHDEGVSDSIDTGKLAALDHALAIAEFEPDGTIITANDTFLRITGYQLCEIAGRHHRILVDPETAASADYVCFWDKLASGTLATGEYLRRCKGGRAVWLNASYNPIFDRRGRVIRIIKIATDATADRLCRAEYEAQREAVHQSQAVIEFDLDGHVLYANDNFCEMMGYSLPEVVGRHHRDFCSPALGQSLEYHEFWQTLRRGDYCSGKFQRLAKSGATVWLQASYNPVRDRSGKPTKVVKYASALVSDKPGALSAIPDDEFGEFLEF